MQYSLHRSQICKSNTRYADLRYVRAILITPDLRYVRAILITPDLRIISHNMLKPLVLHSRERYNLWNQFNKNDNAFRISSQRTIKPLELLSIKCDKTLIISFQRTTKPLESVRKERCSPQYELGASLMLLTSIISMTSILSILSLKSKRKRRNIVQKPLISKPHIGRFIQ